MNPPIGGDANGHTLTSLQTMLAKNPTPAELRAWMTETYSDFAFRAAPEYSKVFVQLREDHLPLLFHCSAGKDRTGVFSALLLLSLGVPEQTVLEDYALTTNYLKESAQSEANRKMMANSGSARSHLTAEQREVLMAADPEYLKSTRKARGARSMPSTVRSIITGGKHWVSPTTTWKHYAAGFLRNEAQVKGGMAANAPARCGQKTPPMTSSTVT
jgi:hypothetical protein